MKIKFYSFSWILHRIKIYLIQKRIILNSKERMEETNKISISYCIPVWNEHKELQLLLNHLAKFLCEEDEVLIQGDQGKVTDEVISVVRNAIKDLRIKYIEYPLRKNFAAYKNNLLINATGDFIFLIDVDEVPSKSLLSTLKFMLHENPEIELFGIPRVNIVEGLTADWVQAWRWNITYLPVEKLDYDTKDVLNYYNYSGEETLECVNWPDIQTRLLKRDDKIRWVGKVHERIEGMKNYAEFPLNMNYCLFHIKGINRQIFQNKFYETL